MTEINYECPPPMPLEDWRRLREFDARMRHELGGIGIIDMNALSMIHKYRLSRGEKPELCTPAVAPEKPLAEYIEQPPDVAPLSEEHQKMREAILGGTEEEIRERNAKLRQDLEEFYENIRKREAEAAAEAEKKGLLIEEIPPEQIGNTTFTVEEEEEASNPLSHVGVEESSK